MGALLARYEWALILPLVLGFAVYELWSVRRSIARDKRPAPPPPDDAA